MKARILLLVVAVTLALPVICGNVLGQSTAFTYQGRLTQSGVAAAGNFDLQFGLYTNTANLNQVGALLTNANVAVSNGVFTTTLNFSNVFNGTAYWLEIGVRTNGSGGGFTNLTPRQPLTPVPYAITASNLTGTLPATQLSGSLPSTVLSGTFSNSLSFSNSSNVFVGNGSGLTGVTTASQSNFLYLYDTTFQTLASANTYQYVTFNTVGSNSGWAAASSSAFVVLQSGLYLVQYQANIENGNTSSALTAGVRAILNATSTPTEIAGSESVVTVPPLSYISHATRSFLLPMTVGQSLSLQIAGNIAGGGAGGFLVAGSVAGQSFPGVSMTVTRIK